MIWCCIEPERQEKTTWLMEAIARGFGGKVCLGDPPDDGEPFVVWGQMWTALREIPKALRSGRPFLQVDNGYYEAGRGFPVGYYRLCCNGMSARFIQDAPPSRLRVKMRPWRTEGRHVILAIPGLGFGRAVGLNMHEWLMTCQLDLRKATDRTIIVRPKRSGRTLAQDFENCWALRTHSSNVAVDAVLYGIPVFVEPTSPAAPVGCLDLSKIEEPFMPDREAWVNSLMAQQFTVDELADGTARDFVRLVSKYF
jgi:hypothetical protein